ncbi:hypothetical protein SAY86_019096 [Trapa natans]|uniref:Polysaccharide biosynthesis domain-containing protein n=1 Tax=Trapa natans TaxID=22666 RepID=A0AAN7R3T0_TRANT|nr:hypothetical protein SAY86_019096 [Trapa natans]
MKLSNTKLILLHPSLHRQSPIHSSLPRRLWLLLFPIFFTLAFTLTRLTTTTTSSSSSTAVAPARTALPPSVSAALLHYASIAAAAAPNTTRPSTMTPNELAAISSALLRPGPLNVLIFGIAHETALFHALNHRGRTVVLDENEYAASKLEQQFEGIEAYDVLYTTRVSETRALLKEAIGPAKAHCRPVQNLLYSECRLALNGLPNHIYDVDWDVILIDGPHGYSPTSPGRMSAIFTAAVLAQSKKAGGKTDVFVHDFSREVERVSSEEFLCRENMVETVDGLAHFVVERHVKSGFDFCRRTKASSSSSSSSPSSITKLPQSGL